MLTLIIWHNRFNENENETVEAHIPRHRDSKTKKPRHRDSKTKKPRHRDSRTKNPRHRDSKAKKPRHRDSKTRKRPHREMEKNKSRHRDSKAFFQRTKTTTSRFQHQKTTTSRFQGQKAKTSSSCGILALMPALICDRRLLKSTAGHLFLHTLATRHLFCSRKISRMRILTAGYRGFGLIAPGCRTCRHGVVETD